MPEEGHDRIAGLLASHRREAGVNRQSPAGKSRASEHRSDWNEDESSYAIPDKALHLEIERKESSGFCRSGLHRRLKADRHDPLAVPLDPQAAYVNRLAAIRLMLTGHHYGLAKIKHLGGNERGRCGTETSLLLQIEGGDTIRLAERMVVAGAEHHEFVGDVRRPGGSVMVGDAGLQRLPGSDDPLLGFVPGLVRQRLARILALLHA